MSNRWWGLPGRSGRTVGTAGTRNAAGRPGTAPAAGTPGPGQVPVPTLTIDALGRKCPIPIIMLAARINEVPIGSVIAVLADDPAAENDVPAWCAMKSHDYVVTQPLERGWAFHIRRGY
jgi:tRNA 2-thiouridine synthesizing protein A